VNVLVRVAIERVLADVREDETRYGCS